MTHDWGRFTVCGGDQVEAKIAEIVTNVGDVVRDVVPQEKLRALILLGGYGRGEGGVVVVDGQERPHNNLDFLLITRHVPARERGQWKERIDAAIEPLIERYGIGLETGVVPAEGLRRYPCLVMWYDMRFGHKTIVGDAAFVPGVTRYRVERILPSDVDWLLINRGSHLLIADRLIARGPLSIDEREFIVRLMMKTIIGYGDAALFFHGDYHWSYQEKGRRMQHRLELPESFRKLYEEAISFRFRPCYEAYIQRDLPVWVEEIRALLAPVHLECEYRRLGESGWAWADYPARAFRHALFENAFSPRETAKRIRNVLRGRWYPGTAPWSFKLGYAVAGPRGALPVCFPVVAYKLEDAGLRALAQVALDARSTEINELGRAFLWHWWHHVDQNFASVARRWELRLEPEEARP